ncbi:MAG: mandelate racemase [Verrucomicrobia bacterium]|nr:MAG: mandelate racemase [Verrucomicrobiota bacterium]
MKIDSVDFYYLSLPVVRDIGDGSQDALLVRVEAGGCAGWGECEASPLVSIASWNCPMSHSACKPISVSVQGQRLESVDDIRRINALVRAQSFDLLQADHTLSGIDIALWDLLGKKLGEPIWRLLGYERAFPKTAYASQLFGDDPQTTLRRAQQAVHAGFRAAKFGWGPYGHGTVELDADHVRAAREGLGAEAALLVDAGTVWGDDTGAAEKRLQALEECRALWLEEPFVSGALEAYRQLSKRSSKVKLAGGEGCHNFQQAKSMIDYAGLGYVQIDTGRIGGITTAKQIADYAGTKGVRFVNHTFTTHLALSASLQPYAGMETDDLCEYPFEPSALARDFTATKLQANADGQVRVPDQPGLGLEPDWPALKQYLVEVEIKVAGQVIFSSAHDLTQRRKVAKTQRD